MVRKAQFEFDRTRRAGRKSAALPVVAAVGLFGLVLATLLSLNGGPQPSVETASRQTTVRANPAAAKPAPPPQAAVAVPAREATTGGLVPAVPQARPADVEPAVSRQPSALIPQTAQDSAVTPSTDDRAERLVRLDAHLDAGEFGLALDLARGTSDAAERTTLLKRISDAQLAAGEFDAARDAIRRIPVPQERNRAHQERVAGQSLAGGSFADFSQLIELIQNQTGDNWADIQGGLATIDEYDTGVRVDPHGMLAFLTRTEQASRLKELGIAARQADLNDDMARPSELRLVSLTRLECEIARRLAAGQPVLETMKHLAGLSQIRYVFVFPDDGEVVIGGPAEGWRYNDAGIPVGESSGTPTLQLDDFVTVFRTFAPGGSAFFNCLIVPRQDGLQRVKEFAERTSARGPIRLSSAASWARQLQELLGPQDAVFNGIPTDSRVARVMLEADYRMKLIGIGRLDGGSDIPSYFDLLTPQAIKENPPQLDALRWWLTMKYDAVLHSGDRNVFEVVGSSVLCQSENELIDAAGQRIHTGQADPTNAQFAANFTRNYDELARRDLVFADLQNIFDLSLIAALLHHERVPDRANWDGGVFAPNGAYESVRYEPPKTVETAVNHRVYNGKDIIVQVAGGVRGDLMAVLRDPEVYQENVRLGSQAARGRVPVLPEGRWWWDAAQK
ncbi:MAG TPA: DUF1598 domain-containing protein [Planctomycetaceae bacterium]|nr:DUF1598 domain-containing protein [Planctomycetaceae bacterium]